jgi:serine/threonine-protein kinase HipA
LSSLTLDVRLDGFAEPIGKLTRTISGNVTFNYTSEHLGLSNALPLSLSLPLQEPAFGDVLARTFFSNLLQERDQPLREVMESHGIEPTDLAGLLFHLGSDCAGAVSILPDGSPPTKVPGNLATDYDVLSQRDLEAIVQALHDRTALPNERRDPSPLTGMQSKISILMLDAETFALPKPGTGAPTTHVMKVPDRNHHADVERETLALQMSAQCGMITVPSARLEFAGIPALMTQRFDRAFNAEGQVIRLHQEDFAQALSLPPSLKYQRRGIEGRRFDAAAIGRLLNETANPADARFFMLKLTLYDLLIGNVDGHAKNHALLYLGRARPDLAPRYDVLPTRLDESLTEEFAYDIGAAKKLQDVDMKQLSVFLTQMGITGKPTQKRLVDNVLNEIVPVLAKNLGVLGSMSQKSFADLIAANMRTLLPKLDYPVPNEAAERDAYVARGGGWLSS